MRKCWRVAAASCAVLLAAAISHATEPASAPAVMVPPMAEMAVPSSLPPEKRNVLCRAGANGLAVCTRICVAGEAPGPQHLCLRPEDVAEIRAGRSVSSQVAFDNDCGLPTSQQHQTVIVTDGDHARMARLISMTVRYTGLPARTRQCAFTTTCENQDVVRDKCKVACVSGSWQSLDGRTFPIVDGCDGF